MDREAVIKIVKDELEYYLKEKENLKREDVKILLKNYTKYKNDISQIEQNIIDLENGKPMELLNFENSILVQKTKKFKSEFDIRQDRIEFLTSKLKNLKYLVSKIENALEIVSNNTYSDIIRLKYFENKRVDEITDEMFISYGTYKKYHAKLINEIKSILFL